MSDESNRVRCPEVGEGDFESEVLHSSQPALVAFGAPWSKPCQIVQSVLSELANECTGKIRVLQVNVDDNPDLGVWYGIESIPTLLGFVAGKVRFRIIGTASKEAILSRLGTLSANTGSP
jgi:thioredoxin-like negative regulator of GroEL